MTIKQKRIATIVIVVLALFLFVKLIMAGSGDTVAKTTFESWWGKIPMAALLIIFFPLILYVNLREHFAVKKCIQELERLQLINDDFGWSKLEKNVKQIVESLYLAWSKEDMSTVSNYVSDCYWQNQQLVCMDKWKRENLKNVCNVQHVGKIRPIHLEITNRNNLEGSKIAFSVKGRIKDYLVDRATLHVQKEKDTYADQEKVWIFEYTDGKWLLNDIREGDLRITLTLARLKNVIPLELSEPITATRQANL